AGTRRGPAVPDRRPSTWLLPAGPRAEGTVLVPVVLRLVRPLLRHAEILRLAVGELGEPRVELLQMEPRDLLVEPLREHVHLVLVAAGVAGELDLGEHLVREARAHHEARVAGGAA